MHKGYRIVYADSIRCIQLYSFFVEYARNIREKCLFKQIKKVKLSL